MLPSIISMPQGAIVQGRHILDGVLVANECILSRLRDKRPSLVCKLDLEKAYDMVEWGFLSYVLQRMGFGSKLRSWIQEYVSLARFSILVNGSPKGFSKPKGVFVKGIPCLRSSVIMGEL